MSNDLVSVVLPTYNRAKHISKAIESVYKQTYRPIELIIVDDCSTDNTEEVVLSWQNKYNRSENFDIKYFKLSENKGACVARNIGLEQSTGRYLQYLDSDDYLESEKISKQIQVMKKKGTPICLCDFRYIDNNGQVIKKIRNNKSLEYFIRNFKSASIMCSLIDMAQIGKFIRWNQNLKRNQDMDYLLRIYSLCDTFSYTPGYFCSYVKHQNKQISDGYHKGIQYGELNKSINSHLYGYYDIISFRRIIDLIILKLRLHYLSFKAFVKKELKKMGFE
jgi:glycosyltransferase involved in cell wall biosynthesis